MDIDSLQALINPLFPGLMGVQLIELTPERVTASLDVRPDLATAGDVLHGGAFYGLRRYLGSHCHPS
jgi:acyl-coenzyme A thioesterase PaaI-like protein